MTTCSRRSFLAGSAAAAGTLLLPRKSAAQPPAPPPKHVYLITIDTLRADHLSMYGYPRITTPFLAELSKQSVLFEQAVCSCSHTNPAHLSLLSGLQPPQHKLHTNIEEKFSDSIRLLSQMFQDQGYRTAACCSVHWLKVFQRGFDHFLYYPHARTEDETGAPYFPASVTVDHALAWLHEQDPEQPHFLWIHMFDPHRPLQAPAEHVEAMRSYAGERDWMMFHWTANQAKQLGFWQEDELAFGNEQDAYDAELHYVDAQLRRLFDAASKRGVNDDALWIITADHGEGLGGHNYRDHGMLIYQEELLVPLIFHRTGPAAAAGTLPGVASHVDLAPTLAEMFEWPANWQNITLTGQSLLPLLNGSIKRLPPRYHFAQRQHRYPTGYSTAWDEDPVYCLLNEQYKYIVHASGQDEFYNLRRDHAEQTNQIHQPSFAKLHFARTARETFQRLEQSAEAITAPEFTGAYEDHLKALGYL